MACGLSQREGAMVGNALLCDLKELGFITEDQRDELCFTISKIQRETERIGKIEAQKHLEEIRSRKLISIGHDGKASKTLQKNSRVLVESKITIIDNVWRGYVSHDTPEDGTGKATGNILIKVSSELFLHLEFSLYQFLSCKKS